MPYPNQTSPNSGANVACLNCRQKHLKCDGKPEGCGRCRTSSLICHFVPSRRGRRGQPNDYLIIDTSYVPDIDDPDFLGDGSLPVLTSNDLCSTPWAQRPQGDSPINIHLIKAFYEYFHPAHPILPPFDLWAASSPPQFLIEVVEFIGLHHLSPGQVPECPTHLWTTIGEAVLSLEKAQAYLFLSILLHARKVPDGAKECIGLAIQCAFGPGLHSREISDTMEIQSLACAESMRRTLWEIFIVDTLLAAVQVGGTLQFNMGTPDVPLPSEDSKFSDGSSVNLSISARDLDRRAFISGDTTMSSLAYRVEATLILRQCIIACETHACEDSIDVLDSQVSAWFHRWPGENSTILQSNGRVNQIDFQAAMIMHCSLLYLHFPKSLLISYLPTTRDIFCSRPPPLAAPSPNPQMHTAKIANAAAELSKLASLSTSVTGHSPFFACTLVLSSIVQLTVLSAHIVDQPGKHYSYLALNIGVLKSMGRLWNIAAYSMEKLQEITREVQSASSRPNNGLVGSLSTQSSLES